MTISIVGSGNVASVLSKLMLRSGHEICEIISRNEATGKQLAEEIGCRQHTNIYGVNDKSQLVVLCINDLGIKKIAEGGNYGNRLLLHTAGSMSMYILSKAAVNYGVLYPLQSLRKEMKEIPEIPFLIDANSEEAYTLLSDLANDLSSQVRRANDEERLKLHLAAVVSSNFSNHLYRLAEDYCKQEGVEFGLLLPLIKETAVRLAQHSPANMQTGPAIRGDEETIQLHLSLLNRYPDLQKIYAVLSESISKMKS
jgi:predicted short-subunit dehydrogenase-like oxidoreductase (DUF2520 family)